MVREMCTASTVSGRGSSKQLGRGQAAMPLSEQSRLRPESVVTDTMVVSVVVIVVVVVTVVVATIAADVAIAFPLDVVDVNVAVASASVVVDSFMLNCLVLSLSARLSLFGSCVCLCVRLILVCIVCAFGRESGRVRYLLQSVHVHVVSV